ncbi:MAG TPA: sigma-70 family RNA polymerase sigma factor [Gallionellaceae bacterium]|nr:sigma-70 family RNA polymerase sigma factor [Gallionellaceae bacterium]
MDDDAHNPDDADPPPGGNHLTGDMAALRRDMVKFARLQLRDEAAAEDAVQEAIAAALAGQRGFRSRSQLKTWVFGILKNKIVDIIRDRARMPNIQAALDEIADDAYDVLFKENGYWQPDARPAAWGDPEESFASRQFWAVFEACLTRLPENTARIFMMREMLELETQEICKELGITATNCWVVLHRARMGLRLCLEERWFDAERDNA